MSTNPMLCVELQCTVRIHLGFFSLSTVSLDGQCCVIMELRHGWKQQENKVNFSLSKILLRMHPSASLSICLCLFICLYFCTLSNSLSLFHTSNLKSLHANVECKFSPKAQVWNVPPRLFIHVLLFPAVRPAVLPYKSLWEDLSLPVWR